MVAGARELEAAPARVEAIERASGYRLVYALQGAPGAALLQRVETTIRALDPAGAALIEYHGRYEELLRLDGQGAARDVHAFDLRRDRWDRAALRALLRAHTPPGAPAAGHVARVELVKRFALGPCADGPPRSGVLAGASARLVLRGPGWELTLPAPAAPAAGAGAVSGAGQVAWRAEEWFGWGAASATGRLRTAGYQASGGGDA